METRRLLPPDLKCPNTYCTNRLGEGTFALVTFEPNITGDKPVQLLICTPCAEIIKMDITRGKAK